MYKTQTKCKHRQRLDTVMSEASIVSAMAAACASHLPFNVSSVSLSPYALRAEANFNHNVIEKPTPESSESTAVKQKCLHWQQSCGAQITGRFAFPSFEGEAEMPALESSESTAVRHKCQHWQQRKPVTSIVISFCSIKKAWTKSLAGSMNANAHPVPGRLLVERKERKTKRKRERERERKTKRERKRSK